MTHAVASMHLGESDDKEEVRKPIRKKKTIEKRRSEGTLFALPRKQAASVSRLAMPRRQSQKGSSHTLESPSTLKGKSTVSLVSQPNLKERHLSVSNNSEGESGLRSRAGSATDNAYDGTDITIFGQSLKKFYGPRSQALKALQKKQDAAVAHRWIYPVVLYLILGAKS